MLKKHLPLFVSFALFSGLSLVRGVEAHAHPPGMLGVALHEVFADEVARLNLPGEYGARVEAVQAGSPAEQAGLQVDDVVVGFNGIRVESARTLRRLVQESPAGRTVELRVIRGGEPMLARATLGEGRETMHVAAPVAPEPKVLGVGVEPISFQLSDLFELEDGQGLFVAQVQKDSAADRAGILARDLLIEVENQMITTGEKLSEFLNALPGSAAVFTVIRNGAREKVTVRF